MTKNYTIRWNIQRLILLHVCLVCMSVTQGRITTNLDGEIGDHTRHISLKHMTEYIENLHNSFRRVELQKHIGNMRRVSWSNSLAQEASVQSSRCDVAYVSRKYGYNYGAAKKTDKHRDRERLSEIIEEMLYEWSRETYDIFKPCAGDCNNFTQLIWTKTTEFGCSVHACTKLSLHSHLGWIDNVYFVVCMYKEKGNIDGEAPAVFSLKPCSGCELTEQCEEGLCYRDECVNGHAVSEDCDKWADRGLCSENVTWMSRHCRRSCRLCGVRCEDVKGERYCRSFRAKLGCVQNKESAKKHCLKTCGMCLPERIRN